MAQRRQYTPQQKEHALAQMSSGQTVREVHDSTGIPESTLRSWLRTRSDRTRHRTIRRVALISILLLTSCVAYVWLSRQVPEDTVIVLYTGDQKGYLMHGKGGIAAVRSLRDQYASQVGERNVVVLDTGDSLYGSFESWATYEKMRLGRDRSPIPVLSLLGMAGYNALAVGNVDLHFGVTALADSPRLSHPEQQPPLLCCNLVQNTTLATPFASSVALPTDYGPIAVIGSLSETSQHLVYPDLLDDHTVVNERNSILREGLSATAGGIRVVLAHSEDWARLANHLDRRTHEGLWLVLCGHALHSSQQAFAPSYRGERVWVFPSVISGPADGHVGIVELRRHHPDDGVPGPWRVARWERLCLAEAVQRHQDVETRVRDVWNWVADDRASIVARTEHDFPGRFASRPSHALGNLAADAMRHATGSDTALMNFYGVRSDLKAGTITRAALWDTIPFRDQVQSVHLNGSELASLLLLNAAGDYRQLYLSGITQHLSWDGERLGQHLEINGTPIDPNTTYTVAMPAYMAAGCDFYRVRGLSLAELTEHSGFAVQDAVALDTAIVQFLKANPHTTPSREPRSAFGQGMRNYLLLQRARRQAEHMIQVGDAASGFSALLDIATQAPGDPSIRYSLWSHFLKTANDVMLTGSSDERTAFAEILRNSFRIAGRPLDPYDCRWYLSRAADVILHRSSPSSGGSDEFEFDVVLLHCLAVVQENRVNDPEVLRNSDRWFEREKVARDSMRRASAAICQSGLALRLHTLVRDTESNANLLLRAEELLVQSRELDPSVSAPRLALWTRLHFRKGDVANGEALKRKYLTLEPEDYWGIAGLGTAGP